MNNKETMGGALKLPLKFDGMTITNCKNEFVLTKQNAPAIITAVNEHAALVRVAKYTAEYRDCGPDNGDRKRTPSAIWADLADALQALTSLREGSR